jgi:hypothetical protein
MSSKGKNPYSDYEFIRSYHTERREAEAAYEVTIVSSICTAVRPDRVVIRMEAYLVDAPREGARPLCSIQDDWPNSTAMSFSAQLFRTAVGLSRLIQDSCADLWKDTLRAQSRGRTRE